MAKTGHYVDCAVAGATVQAVDAITGVDGRTLVFARIRTLKPIVHPNTHNRLWLAMLRQAGLPASLPG